MAKPNEKAADGGKKETPEERLEKGVERRRLAGGEHAGEGRWQRGAGGAETAGSVY